MVVPQCTRSEGIYTSAGNGRLGINHKYVRMLYDTIIRGFLLGENGV